jgi:hypothetical protein
MVFSSSQRSWRNGIALLEERAVAPAGELVSTFEKRKYGGGYKGETAPRALVNIETGVFGCFYGMGKRHETRADWNNLLSLETLGSKRTVIRPRGLPFDAAVFFNAEIEVARSAKTTEAIGESLLKHLESVLSQA